MSFIAVGGTLLAGSAITGGTIAAGAALAGTAASLYGQNKQSKDNAHAMDLNQQAQNKQNDAAWTSWLMSKGVQPTSPVAYGTIPTAGNYTAANVRLPLWANVNMPTGAGDGVSPLVVRRKATPV